ncbi:hypothetical protein AVEN_267594-1 [Araneus ventricosus]|uniref:Uncharacterized protein n=1 Tax=Araneus ventricosus TaxID=182803 RepID=A0A4Y2N3M3_ARAVE|nr:hypothetical protein AVEN_267594-1 [Araneus ventricosus]
MHGYSKRKSNIPADKRVYSGTFGWVGRRHFSRPLTTEKLTSPDSTEDTRIYPTIYKKLSSHLLSPYHGAWDLAAFIFNQNYYWFLYIRFAHKNAKEIIFVVLTTR